MKQTKILCISAVIIALYAAVMFFTQSFAFGAYQVRIATGLYSLSYIFPFLIIPLGLANSLSNILMGGLGVLDIIGGALVGFITSGGVYLVRRLKLNDLLVIPVIILGPGLIVPIWLSRILELPYYMLAASLCIGQVLPAVTGYMLVKILVKIKLEKLFGITGEETNE